ncbi:amino acid adenylation domain-containing protein [Lysinibacillus sp. NPDC058147]|uniref:amino acid adenylation domain-containing protein n=1 Tax=unclassified Lysinibacillus TaxID=2636778 RepID=UPI0036D97F07
MKKEDENINKLIEKRLKRLGAQKKNKIGRRPDNIDAPLSYAQHGVWFANQMNPGDSTYNVSRVFKVEGQLNIKVLESSIQEVIDRHEVLRTSFSKGEEQEAVQVISPNLLIKVNHLDVSHIHEEEKKIAYAQNILKEEADKPFDIEKGMLFRVNLLKINHFEHWLQFIVHHIIFDGTSAELLVKEISALYTEILNNKPSPLKPLGIQYGDYSYWQHNEFDKASLERQLTYWEKKLENVEPLLELPTDYKRPMIRTSNGALLNINIPNTIYRSLKDISIKKQTSLFIIMLAAFKTLLFRYTSREDIALGCPISNRNSQTDDLIGFFINTVVLRTNFSKNMSYQELLDLVKENMFEAFSNIEAPFEKVVKRVQPKRDLSYTPLFQIEFQTEVPLKFEISDLTINELKVDFGKSEYDMTISIIEENENLDISFRYNKDLYSLETIKSMANNFKVLLEAIGKDPNKRLTEYPLLTELESKQLLRDWNETTFDYPEEKPLHVLIEEQVAHSPNNEAVIYKDKRLTYHELNQKANQVAHYLRLKGVGPDTPVVVYMDRSLELVISLLGVLKAGGAYLPVDTEAPKERVLKLIENSRAVACLTQENLSGNLSNIKIPYISVETSWGELGEFPTNNPEINVKSDNLVSIYYTSGSTGEPKGVANLHKGWVNRICWMQDYHKLSPSDTVLQKTILTFDDSAIEFFWPLMIGARIAVLEPGLHSDAEAILEAAIRYNVSFIQFVPSVLKFFLDSINDQNYEELLRLRTVISSGEALKSELIQLHFEKLPHVNLYNQWGPTEVSIDATVYKCSKEDIGRDNLPIGKPIHNTKLYILDEELQPVPVGVIGEIYLSGVGLAKGYLNDAERTKEAFIPDLFDEEDAFMYKTGDRGYYQTDGNIVFIGRKDDQVKIRGVRIELAEIETALNEHSSIKESIVIAHEIATGDKRLIAFLVSNDKIEISLEEIQKFLKDKLPLYMIPNHVFMVEKIPLTSNGKVNRKKLKASIANIVTDEGKGYLEPVTPTQIKLSQIWSLVLNKEKVGLKDNFFEIGGHSLVAVKVINRIKQVFNVKIDLKDIFTNGTLDQLALHIEQLYNEANINNEESKIKKLPTKKNYELSHAQKRLWFLYILNPLNEFYNVPTIKGINGYLNIQMFRRSLDKLIARHEILRTIFVEEEGIPRQIVKENSPFQLHYIDLTLDNFEVQNRKISSLIDKNNKVAFDLFKEPPIRAILFKCAEKEYRFYVNMHHIITDAWSYDIFFRDLSEIYEALIRNEEPSLTPLPIRYVDYADWQNQEIKKGMWGKQEDYWLDKLKKPLPVLELPTDKVRPEEMSLSGSVIRSKVSEDLTKQLQALANKENGSLYMLLFAAYNMLLHVLTEDQDIIVGSPVTGRSVETLEDMIGFFVNTLPIRVRFDKVNTLRDLLQEVKQEIFSAYEYQDYPFDLLVEKVNPQRDSSRSPLFATIFSYNDKNGREDKQSGLNFEAVNEEVSHTTSKMDLTLFATNTPEGIKLSYEYSTDLFLEKTIERFDEMYQKILVALVNQFDEPIRNLDLLPEVDQLLHRQLNDTTIPFDLEKTIPELFYKQADSCANRIALSDVQNSFTYRELNERSNQLAHFLREKGVGPNQPVGIMMDRGAEVIVTMLGILKAGGAYVPIDPVYPEERIQYMLKDSGIRLLLTQKHLKSNLVHNLEAVTLGDIPDKTSIDNLPIYNTSDDLAYVIYTSGSTGQPKGAMLRHMGVVNLVEDWKFRYNDFVDQEIVLQFSSHSFDGSVWEIWQTILCGSHLHILSDEERQSIDKFADVVQQMNASIIFMPTALFHQFAKLLPESDLGKLSTMKRMVVGGEALNSELVREWWRRGGHIEIVNMYGPTEATVFVATQLVNELGDSQSNIPIGKAISNVKLHILNQYMNPCPINTPGELYIESEANLGRGYLNKPEKTKESFIQHPYYPEKQLYKTGDIVRLTSAGTIEYVGRKDGQVKVRGYRIEIGEIESHLLEHQDIHMVAVIPKKENEIVTLIAYYTTTGEDFSEKDIRSYFVDKLPTYMLPAKFIKLEKMPLSGSGKVDRKMLEKYESQNKKINQEVTKPLTSTQSKLVKIWEDILQRNTIELSDSFFDLGGHSLLGIQLLNRVNNTFKIIFSMKDVYQYPTLKEMSERIEQLLSKLSIYGYGERKINRLLEQDRYELSHSQKRLWFLYKLFADNRSYDVAAMYTFKGTLDVPKFEQAFKQVINRHDSLRTSFTDVDGQPYQSIKLRIDFSLEYRDLSGMASNDQKEYINLKTRDVNAEPFDLAKAPLLRAILYKCSKEDYKLYLNMHHIITDAWSYNIFFRDLSEIYEALIRNEAPSLAPLPIRYVDYADWQNQEIKKGLWGKQEDYWLDKLKKPLPVLELPTDKVRPEEMSLSGSVVRSKVSKDLTKQLRALANKEDGSLYMLLFAAYNMLLHVLTEDQDIIVGSPVTGRSVETLEDMIGFFVNTLPIRVRFDKVNTLRDLLQEVKQEIFSAYEHQDYPFDLLVEKVNPQRDSSRSPLFATLFSYHDKNGREDKQSGLNFEAVDEEVSHTTSKMDLSLFATNTPEGIKLSYEYSTDLFLEKTIERFDEMYQNILMALVNQFDEPIRNLDLLPEVDQLLHRQLNDTTIPFDLEKTIPELFYKQADSCANRIALSDVQNSFTYRELNERSNQLAHFLREKGVGPNQPVGIMMDRGAEVIVTMLGILKAGGAYVPIDPVYPKERIQYMLKDSGIRLLLTQKHLKSNLVHNLEAVTLGDIPDKTSIDNLPIYNTSDDLAYVIYTSGSTGQPKGAMLRHMGVVNLVEDWKYRYNDFVDQEIVLQFSSHSFDVSVWEIWQTILCGSHLHILSDEERQSIDKFADVVQQLKATMTLMPTSLFHQFAKLLPESDLGKLSTMKRIVVGGEALKSEFVREWWRRGGHIEIVNVYGPTEATVFVATQLVNELEDSQSNIPIGKAISNVKLHVLNQYMNPCPINTPGELYIESEANLGRGYLNKPEKTKEAFIQHPYYPEKQLYKTGDIVRLTSAGTIEYVGRKDGQIKVRGYRIEIGEIESHLLEHQDIHMVAVVVTQDSIGNNKLVAYYTSTGNYIDGKEMRQFIKRKVPAYLIPSDFIPLNKMPFLPSGKIDRHKLIKQEFERKAPIQLNNGNSTLNQLEEILLNIWAEVLGIDPEGININDNFFDLGGNSLLLMKMKESIKKKMEVNVLVTDLFKYTTISSIAQAIGQITNTKIALSSQKEQKPTSKTESIAIIGIGLRFPESKNTYEFWSNLTKGNELVKDIPLEELPYSLESLDSDILERLVLRGGYLEEIDMFDPDFFQMSHKEASDLDPQQRFFLLCAWEAIENAGYNLEEIGAGTSVYAGISETKYSPRGSRNSDEEASNEFQSDISTLKKFVATRTSYKLNLKGESVVVDTACSTSLVAVHMACQSLLSGQSDYALAGGACVQVPEKEGYVYEPGFILSPDGKCRPFDESANGTVGGNGVGVILLKRLSDAQRDNDPIYAIIKGSAINNDGNEKIGYTAPSPQGVADVIRKAQAASNVDPSSISYIEAHGTGTYLGDPIEVSALKEAFSNVQETASCALGSVKGNIGHTDSAAGIAGLIKTALCLKYDKLVPSINFEKPNPDCGLKDSPFYVNTELKAWDRKNGIPRRAGVSSLGIGGTNAHVILEEPPLTDS